MSRWHHVILGSVCAACVVYQGSAQTKLTAQSTAKFLNIGVGARAAGMGDSFINNGDDIAVVFWNPAGIARLTGTRAMVDVNYWISDIKQVSFAASHDFGDFGVIGASFVTMDYGDIYGTAIDIVAANSGSFEYVETGQVKVSNYAIGLTYARAISTQFSVGGQARFVYIGLGSNDIILNERPETVDNTLKTFAVDLGTRFDTGFKDLTFSMSLRNFSREVRYPHMSQGYYLPLVFTLGLSIDAWKVLGPESTEHSLVLSLNGIHPMDYSEKANIGAEYSFTNQLFLRAGYKINYSIEDVSLGVGVRTTIQDNIILHFDYAYSSMEYFSGVHRLTLSTAF